MIGSMIGSNIMSCRKCISMEWINDEKKWNGQCKKERKKSKSKHDDDEKKRHYNDAIKVEDERVCDRQKCDWMQNEMLMKDR